MGNSNYSAEKDLPQTWIQIFKALKLHQREIKKLHKVFRNIDVDSDGIVDVSDILAILDIEKTKFTERIFAAYDTLHTGKVDFLEFVLCLWDYCSLGKGSLNYFTFDLYDWDESGDLCTDQIHQMIWDFFGENLDGNPQARAMIDELNKISASVTTKGPIDLETFQSFTKFHQAIVYRTFNVQMKLRNTILGDEFWEMLSRRRVKLSKGRYMSLATILMLHVQKGVMEAAVQDGILYKQKVGEALAQEEANTIRPDPPAASQQYQ